MSESELPMTTALLKLLGENKQETPKLGNRYKQMIKQEALDALKIMLVNLDSSANLYDEYDLIRETLEELAK
jgi:hypothetical protein